MFNKILPYKFILGKKIQPYQYHDLFNVIETKPYEIVFYVPRLFRCFDSL